MEHVKTFTGRCKTTTKKQPPNSLPNSESVTEMLALVDETLEGLAGVYGGLIKHNFSAPKTRKLWAVAFAKYRLNRQDLRRFLNQAVADGTKRDDISLSMILKTIRELRKARRAADACTRHALESETNRRALLAMPEAERYRIETEKKAKLNGYLQQMRALLNPAKTGTGGQA